MVKARSPVEPNEANAAADSGRGTLNRERILRSALAVVEHEGLDALTMRRLARRLGVVPTAIYWHIRSRDELLQGILDLVMEQVEIALPTEGSWEERLRALCHTIRDQLAAHPYVFTLAERHPTRAIGPVTTVFLRIAHEAGYEGAEAAETVMMFQDYAIGTAYTKAHGEPSNDFVNRWHETAPGDPSEMLAILEYRRDADRDAAFDRGLTLMIDGLRGRNQRRDQVR